MKKKVIIGSTVAVVAAAAVIIGVFVANNDKVYDYDLTKYGKFGDYKGMEYSIEKVSVTDEEVETEINQRLAQAATTKTVEEGTVNDGDTVNVAYVGKIDGKTFDGGSSESSDITIGTTPMIDGFTEGLVGHKVGEKVTLNLKFPDDYQNEDVAGKDVVFEVTINSKKVTETPTLDEKFVKKNSDEKTVAGYKKAVKKELLEKKEESAEQAAKQELWTQIVEKTEVKKYPEKEMKLANKKADEWEEQYKAQASSYGMEWEDFLKTMFQTDEDGFKDIKKSYAKDIVKNEMTLYYIADKENVKVSNKEYKEYLDEILENANYTKDSFKEAFNMSIEKYAEQYDWKQGLLLDKVLDKVMEYGKEK